jgi:hypothetical protein
LGLIALAGLRSHLHFSLSDYSNSLDVVSSMFALAEQSQSAEEQIATSIV